MDDFRELCCDPVFSINSIVDFGLSVQTINLPLLILFIL